MLHVVDPGAGWRADVSSATDSVQPNDGTASPERASDTSEVPLMHERRWMAGLHAGK